LQSALQSKASIFDFFYSPVEAVSTSADRNGERRPLGNSHRIAISALSPKRLAELHNGRLGQLSRHIQLGEKALAEFAILSRRTVCGIDLEGTIIGRD
jgi:hypothetical protein